MLLSAWGRQYPAGITAGAAAVELITPGPIKNMEAIKMGLLESIKLGKYGFKPDDIKACKEQNINTDDIIGLAEKGYTPEDVKQLITLSNEAEGADNHNTDTSGADNEDHNDPDPDDTKDEAAALNDKLAEQEAELVKLRSLTAKLQNQNAGKDLSGGKVTTPREQVQEVFRNLY